MKRASANQMNLFNEQGQPTFVIEAPVVNQEPADESPAATAEDFMALLRAEVAAKKEAEQRSYIGQAKGKTQEFEEALNSLNELETILPVSENELTGQKWYAASDID